MGGRSRGQHAEDMLDEQRQRGTSLPMPELLTTASREKKKKKKKEKGLKQDLY